MSKSDRVWLPDLQAVTCAGNAWLHGASPYYTDPSCPFGPAVKYVYPPLLATFLATLQSRYGQSFELALYGALFGAALAGVLYSLTSGAREELLFRAPFLCALTNKAVFTGNVSLILNAALFFAVVYGGSDVLSVALIAVCGACKPTLAVFSAIFLFKGGSLLYRLALSGASLLGMSLYFIWFHAYQHEYFEQWLDAARAVGLSAPSHSFLALPGIAALSSGAQLTLYAAFACVLLASALVIRHRLAVRDRDRLLVGIAVCTLLNPRLMPYDEFTLPFGMAVVAKLCSRSIGGYRPLLYAAMALLWVMVVALGVTRGGILLFKASVALIVVLGATLAAKGREASRASVAAGNVGVLERPASS